MKVLAEPEVKLIVPVPVTVSPVEVALHTVPEPVRVHVPEPMAAVLVLVPLRLTPPVVILYEPASKVPVVIINDCPLAVNVAASCNVTDPDGVFIVIVCVNDFPALVIL